MATAKTENPRPLGPPAIWTAFARQGRWKNWVLLAQFLVIGMLLSTNIVLAGRPPDVVLVTPEGKGTYVQANVASEALARWVATQKQQPTDLTLLHFTKTFLGLALEVNSSTIESTWPAALELMAPPLRDRMAAQAEAEKMVETTKLARVQTGIDIDDLLVVQTTKDLVHLKAKVTRTKRSLMADAKTADNLAVDLVLRVVPRSLRYPDGVQVAEWTLAPTAAPEKTPQTETERPL